MDRKFKFDSSGYSFSEKNISQCVRKKINNIDKRELAPYNSVEKYLSEKNAKIFSFPGDPIFYILFNQKPPYYPTIYEATPIYAQKKLIKFIEENKINYVILNIKSTSIQDTVPDKMRARILYEYIMNNFKKEKQIDNFLIFKKIQ
jgi:ankyrin repeat protein